MEAKDFIKIMKAELVMAYGCTEPAAVAYAVAIAKENAGGSSIVKIEVAASVNIIKNVAAVYIPGTNVCGMEMASALGAVIGQSEGKLEVLSKMTPQDLDNAKTLVRNKTVDIRVKEETPLIYIEATVKTDKGEATAIISGHHTHLASLEVNGKVLVEDFLPEAGDDIDQLEKRLTPDNIWNFINKAEIKQLDIIDNAVKINTQLGQEGLKNPYGLEVGRTILNNAGKEFYTNDLCSYAMSLTAAGSDARMGGCSLPAYANSGSGNQGIQSILPVVAVAQRLDKNEELMLRAVALSCLITIYIKSYFGRLSALCGATVAATGAGCGIVYLMGGNLEQVKYTIQNMLGNVSGILCDGAKAGCALKIATCTSAAVQSALLALNHIAIKPSDGIIEKKAEDTVENLGRLSHISSVSSDKAILEMIMGKA